jgi:hypothetical protein
MKKPVTNNARDHLTLHKPASWPHLVLPTESETTRPETPELERRMPLPEEVTGRASGTDDDLVSLFGNESDEHVRDGFRGGSQDDPADRANPLDADDDGPPTHKHSNR